MDNNKETVLVEDIAFAAKKDGSFIANFSKTGGGKEQPDVEALANTFSAMVKFIETSPEKEFMMFSFIYLVEHRRVSDALLRRMQELKTDKEKKNE
ncbi:MAG: hypothetical protein IJK99_09120 [Bacteroidales bacterium]|nr:hypothetical protein [Bacteroidales bacterium]